MPSSPASTWKRIFDKARNLLHWAHFPFSMVAELIDQTVVHFPRFTHSEIAVEPLEKGGSDRCFYRVRMGGEALILAKYGMQRDENRHYVSIAQFLHAVGVRAPQIYFHDEAQGLIWMEDLGDSDLWSYREQPWPVRRELYKDTLDQALKLHSLDAAAAARPEGPRFQPGFTTELYEWEQGYFLENCLGRAFGLSSDEIDAVGCRARLKEIASFLAEQPRVLVHRDFQSQNIVVKAGHACLIDFQGMRPGLPQYDLASLLYDPYVTLTEEEHRWLLGYYFQQQTATQQTERAAFDAIYDLCAMQRLMQALGAYGFLGLVRERKHFLQHIPAAMSRLKSVLTKIPGLGALSSRLESLPERPAGAA